jgi:hypothetical protein
MALDGKGNVIFNSLFDERGVRVFSGNFNEYGHFAAAQARALVILTEILTIADTKISSLTRYVDEPLIIADSALKTINKMFLEQVNITISNSTKLTRTIAETVLLSITRTTELIRTLLEQVTIGDIFTRRYLYTLLESLTLTETMSNISFERAISIPVIVSDNIEKSLTRIIDENIVVSIIFYKGKVFLENVVITTASSKSLRRIYSITMSISETFSTRLPFLMKKLGTKILSLHRSVKIKIEDGRDAK